MPVQGQRANSKEKQWALTHTLLRQQLLWLKERFSLLRILVFWVLAATAVPTKKSVSQFLKPDLEGFSWSSLCLRQCPFLGVFIPGQWVLKIQFPIFIFSSDHSPKCHIAQPNVYLLILHFSVKQLFSVRHVQNIPYCLSQTYYFYNFPHFSWRELLSYSSQNPQSHSLCLSIFYIPHLSGDSPGSMHTPYVPHDCLLQALPHFMWTTAMGS